MELISPIAALTVLCFVLVAREVLTIDTNVLAIAQQCSHSIKSIQHSSLREGKILGGFTARTADSNWPEGCFLPYDACSVIKAKRKEEREHLLLHLSSKANTLYTEVLLPRKWLVIACSWEIENEPFVFLCFHICFIKLPFHDPWDFFSSYFLLPYPADKGSDRVAWWASGIQPGSAHLTRSAWNLLKHSYCAIVRVSATKVLTKSPSSG